MMRNLWLCGVLLLTACGSPPRATPLPTPVIIRVALTPALRPLETVLNGCAKTFPEVALILDETPTNALDINQAVLVLRFGGSIQNAFTAEIGEDTLAVIVNPSNPELSLSTDMLNKIYTGKVTSWDEVGGEVQPIQVWDYPEGEDIRSIMDAVLFPKESLTPQASIAPDPQAMLDAITKDPTAIGYVPQAWLSEGNVSESVQVIQVTPALADQLRQPLLAFSNREPEGVARQFFSCLQTVNR